MRNSICVTVACLMLGATPHLEARTVQGDRHLAEGRAFEARKQYDAALASYREAMAQDPAEIVYQMAAAKCVFQAAEAHMALFRSARAEGLTDKALAEFATAHALAPALSAAVQELAVTADMMRRNDRLTPLERVKKQQDDDRDRILPVPELQASTSGAITLTMVNQSPKVLFETNDNPNKRRDYEEQVTRVFYLSNVNTPQEMQEIINTVRSMADLQRVMQYSTQYAIVARGEADKIALAAALIADLDKPRSEVVVDLLVLEASQVFSRKITAALASTGLSVPVNFSPRASIQTPTTTSTATTSTTTTSTTSTTASTIPLSSLGHLASADFSVSLPGALLQAVMSDA